MMETTRGVVRVLNGANSRVGIGSYAVMSGALIAATSYPVTGLLSKDLHLIRRGHQTDSLQDCGLVRSQELRATLSWEGKRRKDKKRKTLFGDESENFARNIFVRKQTYRSFLRNIFQYLRVTPFI